MTQALRASVAGFASPQRSLRDLEGMETIELLVLAGWELARALGCLVLVCVLNAVRGPSA